MRCDLIILDATILDSTGAPRFRGDVGVTGDRITAVGDLGLLSLEAAVHKMTGRTAEVFGLVDRGVIRAGAFADLVLFDPATVRDAADFEHPTRPTEGIFETWVNGQSAYAPLTGASTARAGRVITRNRA